MTSRKLTRIEGDPTTPEYGMSREELAIASFSTDKAQRDKARLELARREYNKLVKRAGNGA